MDFNDQSRGWYNIKFRDGHIETHELASTMYDSNGHINWLVGTDGTWFNWGNILRITPVNFERRVSSENLEEFKSEMEDGRMILKSDPELMVREPTSYSLGELIRLNINQWWSERQGK